MSTILFAVVLAAIGYAVYRKFVREEPTRKPVVYRPAPEPTPELPVATPEGPKPKPKRPVVSITPDVPEPVVEPYTVKVDGIPLQMVIKNGFNNAHQLEPRTAPTEVVVEVPESSNVQFLLYPKYGPVQLEVDFLENEDVGDIKEGFRTVSRSVDYRQIYTVGPATIKMPVRKKGFEPAITTLKVWASSSERNESVVAEFTLT